MKITDEEAIAIAKEILFIPYTINELGKIVKSDERSLWEEYENSSTIDFPDKQFLLAIIRKSLADNFRIQEYYFWLMPYENIALFTHKEDCDNFNWHFKEIPIRQIGFVWDRDSTSATPLKAVFSESSNYCFFIPAKTCQEAVSSR